jgi:hypothetical protein
LDIDDCDGEDVSAEDFNGVVGDVILDASVNAGF